MSVRVLVASFKSWHMDHTAKTYEGAGALAGMYSSIKNTRGITPSLYHRCWPFHVCMKPFYHTLPPIEYQKVHYYCLMGVFERWLRRQKLPEFNVMQAIYWGAKTPFDIAEKTGALKVLDATNSYPTTYDGYERRELALWGRRVNPAIPSHIIEQVVRDVERADVILCPSVWVKDSMIANGVSESKCFLNPFGVDTSVFQERKALPEHPRFVCVGSICLRKGHQYLFQAFERLKALYPDAELVCLGEVLSDFKPLWKRWRHLVTSPGHVTHQELVKLFNGSTAFILPSVEEGFARAIIEGMASGLPILATYESGATTLVRDGIEGLIFKARSIDAIEEAMIDMIEHPEKCVSMGARAAIKGRVGNTWKDYGNRNLEIFESILTQSSAVVR